MTAPRTKGLIHAADVDTPGDPPPTAGPARELVEIASAPLIVHAMWRLATSGITDIGIVVDCRTAVELADVVNGALPPGVAVTYLETDWTCGLGAAVRLAERFAEGGPLVVHSTAALILDDVTALLASFVAGSLDAMVVRPLSAARDRSRNGAPGAAGAATAPPQPVLHVLGPSIYDVLDDAPEEICGERLGPALAALVADGRVGTRWVEAALVDASAVGQLEANRRVLQRLEGDDDGPPSVSIHGPVAIHEDATVDGSTIRGPVVIGAGAHVSDAYLGPYTSLGRGATVTGVEIENSIVMSGATVRHLGVRIEGSVIGRRCVVDRAFELPRALRVHLGDTARLVVS